MVAKLTPNSLHKKLICWAQDGRKEEDIFPTIYKCNTPRKLRDILTQNQFDRAVFTYEAEPQYLSFSKIAYRLGVAHQRRSMPFAKNTIFAFAQRQP